MTARPWLLPDTGTTLPHAAMMIRAARAPVVLLGHLLGGRLRLDLVRIGAALLFLGGWLSPFQGWTDGFLGQPSILWLFLKAGFFAFCFLWFRATFPRYRYDQLMRLGWKVFLPLSLLWVALTAGALMLFGWLPGQA